MCGVMFGEIILGEERGMGRMFVLCVFVCVSDLLCCSVL